MAINLKKKPQLINKTPADRPVPHSTQQAEEQARERYSEMVRAKAFDNVPPDMTEWPNLTYWIKGLNPKRFREDVHKLLKAHELMQQMRELDETAPELDRLREQYGQWSGEFDDLRLECNDREVPLVQMIQQYHQAVINKISQRRSGYSHLRDMGNRNLIVGVNSPSPNMVLKLQHERDEASRSLIQHAKTLALSRHHERRCARLREQIDAWKKGQRLDLMTNIAGKLFLPTWHAGGPGWGQQLDAPTPGNVRDAEERFKKFRDSYPMPKAAQKCLDDCRQAIADLDAQIAEQYVAAGVE